ncbi:MAG: hypothetical protein ACP5NL_03170 [Thermoplasmata archaeon]
MSMYQLKFTENAKKVIEKENVKELYINIRYVQGPCSDNLCRLIPKIEIDTFKPENIQCYMIYNGLARIYAIQPIKKAIEKYRDTIITINYSKLRNRFTVSGITYSY